MVWLWGLWLVWVMLGVCWRIASDCTWGECFVVRFCEDLGSVFGLYVGCGL